MEPFDPFDVAVADDPYPTYARLRADDPVHWSPALGGFVLTRYDDVLATLRDHGRFSSGAIAGDMAGMRFLISSDPPDHTKLRRLVNRPFTPSAIAAMEPRVRRICEDLLAEFMAASERGEADLIHHFGEPLPVIVIAEMLGIPPERRADFKRWSDAMLGGLTPDFDREQGALSAMEMFQYFGEVIEQRRSDPGEDLISLLVTGAEPLEPQELLMFCMLLLIAGNETTTNLISNGALALFDNPDQVALLRDDPGLIPAAIEEALRYDAPVQALWRQATEDVELHGTTIPAGARVVVVYAAANRDPDHYPRPDDFEVERNPRDHVAFGAGIHLCLGAPLARLEARVLTEVLLEHTRGMRPVGPGERIRNAIVRGMRSIPVTFERV